MGFLSLPTLFGEAAVVIKFVGVSQPKPMHGYFPNFQGMFTSRVSGAAMQHFLKFVGVPQPTPTHRF